MGSMGEKRFAWVGKYMEVGNGDEEGSVWKMGVWNGVVTKAIECVGRRILCEGKEKDRQGEIRTHLMRYIFYT